jgi:creatinine amidohydrolase/Fe(II)-dependent formamide hydrolase-like protein
MHAGVIDTSEMMYLDKDGTHVRKDKIKDAVGIPVSMDGKVQQTDDPKLKNGIVGDARKSSVKLGKRAFDIKVEYAVKQIQSFIPPKS